MNTKSFYDAKPSNYTRHLRYIVSHDVLNDGNVSDTQDVDDDRDINIKNESAEAVRYQLAVHRLTMGRVQTMFRLAEAILMMKMSSGQKPFMVLDYLQHLR